MTSFIQSRLSNQLGFISLDRPKALNSLTLPMVRTLTRTLLEWQQNPTVTAVVIHGSQERAFCAGGDIRFFHDIFQSSTRGDIALVEDFFSEEYALNYLIHTYPKPVIALFDGVVMGGGMGIGQAGPDNQLRIVTERTKMAMPEVNIGLFPDVGASYFLSRCPGALGIYLGLTGAVIGASDALYAGLADLFVPGEHRASLFEFLEQSASGDPRKALGIFAAPFAAQVGPSTLAAHRELIERHFSQATVAQIMASLAADSTPFAQSALALMQSRSPLMMCVTLEQLRRGSKLGVADCLRMERGMVRHCFQHGEVLEGIRALVVDKDLQPRWQPASLAGVTEELVESFFAPVWPAYAHPLRTLV